MKKDIKLINPDEKAKKLGLKSEKDPIKLRTVRTHNEDSEDDETYSDTLSTRNSVDEFSLAKKSQVYGSSLNKK